MTGHTLSVCLMCISLFLRSQFANCKLRVFSLGNKAEELARETRKYVLLLQELWILCKNTRAFLAL